MIFRRKRLPAPTGRSSDALRGVAPSAPPGTPPKKILLVDDDPVVLRAMSLKLQSRGYQVITSSDGPQALAIKRREKPDLMLLDVNLPADVSGVHWNGFSLMQWLKRLNAESSTPVFVISGSDRSEYKDRASAVGATAFFRKAVDDNALFAAIDQSLSADRVGTQLAAAQS